ncbi:MAG: sulfurtransferase complex subunit TusD [Candidatus Pelagadaptatus aseana]
MSFARAVIAEGHQLYRVFFYGDATLCGGIDAACAPQWQTLAASSDVDLVLCSTSADKRGLFGNMDAVPETFNGFTVSGLGQLVDAGIQSDRLVTFN